MWVSRVLCSNLVTISETKLFLEDFCSVHEANLVLHYTSLKSAARIMITCARLIMHLLVTSQKQKQCPFNGVCETSSKVAKSLLY